MLLNKFTYHQPKSIEEACQLMASLENAKIIAGGSFLLNSLKLLKRKGLKTPEHVVSLQRIEDLKGIYFENKTLKIMSMTTIAELFDSEIIQKEFPLFKLVATNISTQPIRNMATVGGNLTCRYTWTELPVILLGANAKMIFLDEKGNEEIVMPEDFYKGLAKTNNIFSHFLIEKDERKFSYQRVKKTSCVDIPLFSLLISTIYADQKLSQTIVSINNGNDFAQRDLTLESYLNGKGKDLNIEEALNNIDNTIYTKRSSEYKQQMFRLSLTKAIKELCV